MAPPRPEVAARAATALTRDELVAWGERFGARVRVRLGDIDGIALDVSGTVVERLDAAPVSGEDDSGEDEEPVAGPIAIAVDVSEGAEPDSGADNPAS